MKKKNNSLFLAVSVTVALILVLLLDTWQVFRLTSTLTLNSGRYHLESITGELERTVSEAEQLAMEVGLATYPLLDNKSRLEKYIYERKAEIVATESGCFNVYIAGTGWAIIPDFDMPKDYIATGRSWYKGAKKANGKPYVTAPYVDAMTGDICYTVAVLLGDNDTVLALDYTMDNIQSHIVQMDESGSQQALIVTGDGIIAGCSDESMIGQKLNEALPEYSSIYSLVKSRGSFVTMRIKSGLLYENLFATASAFGWYLIVSESDWNLYQSSYIQLIGTAAIAFLLLLVLVVFMIFTARRARSSMKLAKEKSSLIEKISAQITEPLNTLLDTDTPGEEGTGHSSENMVRVRTAARQVLEALKDNSPVYDEETKKKDSRNDRSIKMNASFRARILNLIMIVIAISVLSNLWVSLRWGKERLNSETSAYNFELTEWIGEQKRILDMFCSVISTNPSMLEDYEGTIAYLDRITQQYPEISVTYMTNPDLSPTVFMNNGWLPPEGWNVEERQWYIDTMNSATGWSISAPYYDEQTGLYCITLAERVYDAETNEYLGTFGIDFFMDKLISILGGSYSNTGYAFLVDPDGTIINHPYGSYQMSEDVSVNVSELNYGELKPGVNNTITIRDYDGVLRILSARRNEQTHFVIYVAVNFFTIYSALFLSGMLILLLLIICAVMIYRLLSDLMHWQDDVNKEMKKAADTAISAGKAKSRFLAQMSHEIRTPINAVLGMNEMILRESKDKNILEYSSNIQAAGKTLLSLINSILDFSKIEEGKMVIVPVEYDVSSMINNLVASVSERVKKKNLKLVVDVDETLPSRLYGDDVRLTQVISNILTNAVKYTEAGEVVFSIYGGARKGEEIELKVSVKDTGIGIKEEDLPKLFESFERLDEVRNHSIEGTGLGMSIVTKLLDMMGSKLDVESVYGKGSTFSFAVWQKIMSDKPIGNYTARLEASRMSGGNETLLAENARILVVDDNEMNLKVAQNLLKLFAITPDLAGSGREALSYARTNHYHIIFLDHMMPEMDGIETLAELKKEQLLNDGTAVIALTANAVNGAKELYLSAGFDGYLSKPIEVSKLEEQLIHFLPEEIYHFREKEEQNTSDTTETPASEAAADNDPIEQLRSLGYNVDAGLQYAAGDRNFYLELAGNFAGSFENNLKTIRSDYESNDLHSYRIHVHSLKSAARQIGADKLADLALSQETAASENNAEAVKAGVETLLSCYETTGTELCGILGVTSKPDDIPAEEPCISGSEDEIVVTLKKAAEDIENFDNESAAESLKSLSGVTVNGIALHEPIAEILQALDDFDSLGAGEKLSALLERINKA